jgi:hypothetical protein
MFFPQNLPLTSQVWFLKYSAPNQINLGHKGHLNTWNKFAKEVFPKSNDFPSDSGWAQKTKVLGERGEIHEIKGARAMDSLQG